MLERLIALGPGIWLLGLPIGLAAFVLVVYLARSTSHGRWLLLGTFIYATSLGKYRWHDLERGPLLQPYELLVQNGRLVAIGCLLALLVTTFALRSRRVAPSFPYGLGALFCMHLAMTIKVLCAGYADVALKAIVLDAALIALLSLGVSTWCRSAQPGPEIAITFASSLFLVAVLYHRVFGQFSNMYDYNGRLFGTTPNPQHAGMLLALSVPSSLYLMYRAWRQRYLFASLVALLVAMASVYLIVECGSRTAMLMVVCSMAFFMKGRVSAYVVLAMLALPCVYLVAQVDFGALMGSGLPRSDDTRTLFWRNQIDMFLRFPLFGEPVHENGELLPSVSSWLGALQILGVVGGFIVVAICVTQWRLFQQFRRISGRANHWLVVDKCDVMCATMCGLFVGSFLEAYMLAYLGVPILVLYLICCQASGLAALDGSSAQGVVEP